LKTTSTLMLGVPSRLTNSSTFIDYSFVFLLSETMTIPRRE
jgi:hypothetical protein